MLLMMILVEWLYRRYLSIRGFSRALEFRLDEIFTDIDGDLAYLVEVLDSGIVNASIDQNQLLLTSLINGNGVSDMVVTAINHLRTSVQLHRISNYYFWCQ